jgi:hypothetical protein
MNHRCELSVWESGNQALFKQHRPSFVQLEARDKKWPGWPKFPIDASFTKCKEQELQRLVTKSAKKRKLQINLKFGDKHILGKEMNEEIAESMEAHNTNPVFKLPKENVEHLERILDKIEQVQELN